MWRQGPSLNPLPLFFLSLLHCTDHKWPSLARFLQNYFIIQSSFLLTIQTTVLTNYSVEEITYSTDDSTDWIIQNLLLKQITWQRDWRKPAWHRATATGLPSWRRKESRFPVKKKSFWRRLPHTQLGRTWAGLSVVENWRSGVLLEQQQGRRGSERERPELWNRVEAKTEEKRNHGKAGGERRSVCSLFNTCAFVCVGSCWHRRLFLLLSDCQIRPSQSNLEYQGKF